MRVDVEEEPSRTSGLAGMRWAVISRANANTGEVATG